MMLTTMKHHVIGAYHRFIAWGPIEVTRRWLSRQPRWRLFFLANRNVSNIKGLEQEDHQSIGEIGQRILHCKSNDESGGADERKQGGHADLQ